MSVDELRQEIKNDMKSLHGALTEMATDLAGLTAKLDGSHDRHSNEIGVLFDRQRELANRVQAIEVSYVPRDEHRRHVEGNGAEHMEFRTAIGGLQVNVGKLVAMAALIGGGTGVAGVIAKTLISS